MNRVLLDRCAPWPAFWRMLLLGLVLWCVPENAAHAAEAGGTAYRRMFVPADSPETWPVGSQRYLPIPRTDFSALIEQNRLHATDQLQAPVSISKAIYRAKLKDGSLQGTAEFTVELPDQQTRLLPLSPLNLAVQSAVWRSEPAQAASFGLWKRQEGAPESAVFVEKSGTLVLGWQLTAQRNDVSRATFELKVPVVTPQTLELSLPANHLASLSPGQLLRTDQGALGETRWVFQLAASESHQLHIDQPLAARAIRSLPFVSQATSYQLKTPGLKVVTQFRLDARESQIAELSAEVSPGLRIVNVAIDQRPVAWQMVDIAGENRLVFARPPSEYPQLIAIRGLAKFPPDLTRELPKIRLREVAWTEGTTSLLVSPKLELRLLNPRQAALQHIVGIADDVSKGEVFRIQEWSDEAVIEVRVGRRKPRLTVRSATTLDLGRDEAKASVVAIFSSEDRQKFQIQAAIADGWVIESVTTTPQSALGEWHIEERPNHKQLRLQLKRPVAIEDTLRVEIKARQTTGEAVLPATIGRLKLVRFLEVDTTQQFLLLRTRETQLLTLHDNVERARLTREELTPAETELLPDAFAGTLLELSALDESEIVELRPESAKYNAEVKVEVHVAAESITHHYAIEGKVMSGAVAEIVLESDQPLPESLRWKLGDQPNAVIAQRIEIGNNVENRSTSDVRYSLRLPIARTDRFRLEASYSSPAQATETCNAIRLPQANDWGGRVLLHGALEGLRVVDQNWTPIVSTPSEVAERLPLLGSYRLGPEQSRQNGSARLQLLREDKPATTSKVVAWLAEYRTLQAANGAAIHLANYWLENLGADRVEVVLPEGAELQEAWLSNRQLDPEEIGTRGASCQFRLPGDQRWPSLVIKYSTRDTALGDTATLQPVVPRCSFPVNLSRWTLWAPEQYQIDNTRQHYASQHYHWWRRIFGPLARSRGESVFNPVQASDWAHLFSDPLVGQQTKQSAEKLARQLTSRLQAGADESWAELILELTEEAQVSELMGIDRAALLAKGIEANTSTQQQFGAGRTTRALDTLPLPLSGHGLALLVSPGSIVLTSEDRVAQWRDQLRPTEMPGVFMVDADGLASRLEQVRKTHSMDIVDPTRWMQFPNSAKPSWDSFATTTLTDVGRHTQTVEFLETLPTLVVRRAFVGRALWYAVLLLTLVLGVWQLAHYPNKMILVGAIAGAACLIVPIRWLTIPQAVFLGLVAAAIVRIVIRSAGYAENDSRAMRQVAQATVALLLGGLCLWTAPLQAQPSPAPETTPAVTTKLPLLLVPIDAQGSRQGEDVYLSADFLQNLQKIASSDAKDRPQWVLLKATYRGQLPGDLGDSSPENLNINEPWTLLWKVESFVPNCRLILPLQRDEATWQADAHRLDGLPVELDWQKKGHGCAVTLAEPGVHWLRVVALPQGAINDRSATLRLHIPPLPGAVLDLTAVPSSADLQVSAAVRTLGSEDREQLQFVLSDSDTIEVTWAPEIFKDDTTSWDRLEQLSWLHVDPAGARLDVQLALQGLRSTSHVLELEISPQLKLVLPGEDSPIEDVVLPTQQHPNRLQLKLRQGLPEEAVISLRFDLQRAVSVGRLYFPRVRLVDHLPDQTLFAVSVSAGLSYDESVLSSVRSIEPSEFSATWNNAEVDPLFAYALGQKNPAWSLRVRPDPQSFTAQQTLRMYCLPKKAHVEFEAVLDNLTGRWLSHRMLVPPSLIIDAITVESQTDMNAIPVRWSRVSETEAVVFLGRPLQKPHSIQLRGHVNVPASNEIEIPKIQLVSNERSEIHFDLYRTDEVQVHWTDPKLAPERIQQQQVSHNRAEIHVGHFSWRSSEAAPLAKLRLERNEQVFEVASLTTVELGPAGWSATLNARVQVRQGVVSRLSLEAPHDFLGPYVVLPTKVGVLDEIETTSTGQKITLLLAQPATAGEEIEVRLRGRLGASPRTQLTAANGRESQHHKTVLERAGNLTAEQRLVVPALRWKGATQEERYVLLPTLVNKQPMEWQRSGLRRTALPAKLRAFVTSEAPALPYHVEQNQFQATERSYRGTLRNALIRSAKVSGTLDQQGLLIATAELILQPGRATSCAIQLPESAELTQLVVGDQPARRERRPDGHWSLTLGPPWMPRRIVVSYRLQHDLQGERLQLTAPKILIGDQTLPSPQTLWRLSPTEGLLLGKSPVGRRIDPARFFEEDYRLTLQTLQDARAQAAELPQQEGRLWLRTWQKLAQQAEVAWQTNDHVAQSELEAESPSSELFSSRLSYPPRLPLNLGAALVDSERFYLSEPGSQLVLSVQSGSPQNLWQWFAALAMACGTLAVVLQLKSKPQWHRQLCQWPHSLALGGGLCWWLLLKPSVVGLLVIVLTCTSLAIKQWRRFRRTIAKSC